jgi:hypothetical protein
VPSHEQAKQNSKWLFFLWKILGYLQILVWLIHTKVQVCIKEYQTLPFFDGIFATVFGQLKTWIMTEIMTHPSVVNAKSADFLMKNSTSFSKCHNSPAQCKTEAILN